MQRVIDKGLDLEEALRILDYTDRLPIPTTVSLIMGYPEETMDDFRQTVAFLGETMRLDLADPQLHRLAPLAETPLSTMYRDRLTLDGFYSDMSRLGSGYYEEDMLLISAHPDIFPNFYAMPCPLTREYLQESRTFLVNGYERCKSLFAALHQESGDLLEIFEEWTRWRPVPACVGDYYSRIQFFEDLVAFTAEKYVGRGWVATEVTCRYYQALLKDRTTGPDPVGADLGAEEEITGDAIPVLSPGVKIVRVRGDIVRAMRAIRERQPAPWDCLDREVTVAVRPSPDARFSVTGLPEVSALLITSCDGRSTVADIVQSLAHYALPGGLASDRFCPHALEILRRQGLIRLVVPFEVEGDEIEIAEPVSPFLAGAPLA